MAGKSDRVLVSPEGLELLTAAKARLGLSFAAIAERAGVSVGTVQRLFHPERGQGVRAGERRSQNHSSAEILVLEQVNYTIKRRSRSRLCRSTATDSKGC
jgi:transposase